MINVQIKVKASIRTRFALVLLFTAMVFCNVNPGHSLAVFADSRDLFCLTLSILILLSGTGPVPDTDCLKDEGLI